MDSPSRPRRNAAPAANVCPTLPAIERGTVPLKALKPAPYNPRRIDPAYCDVIVQRWETLTGAKAERIPAPAA